MFDVYLQGPGQTTMGIYIRAVVKGGAADKVCLILYLVLLSINKPHILYWHGDTAFFVGK